jgi:hypothetical protein
MVGLYSTKASAMKTTSLTLLLSLAFAANLTTLAGEKQAPDTRPAKAVPANCAQASRTRSAGSELVLLTGSYLKQDVRRDGRITDGANQVIIIDRKSIERSGASSLRQVLSRTGIR